MNLLTDKCLADFENWLLTDYTPSTRPDYKTFTDGQILGKFKRMGETLQYTIIQEFFDSVGIYIGVITEPSNGGEICYFNYKVNKKKFSPYNEDRKETWKAAIIIANELYNQRQ